MPHENVNDSGGRGRVTVQWHVESDYVGVSVDLDDPFVFVEEIDDGEEHTSLHVQLDSHGIDRAIAALQRAKRTVYKGKG